MRDQSSGDMVGNRDAVLARLSELCPGLEKCDAGSLVLPSDTGMRVEVEWVERRTPVLRETYAVAGIEAWSHLGEVVIAHKLTQRLLKSSEQLEELLLGVRDRSGLMASPALAYGTAIEVMSGREARFGTDDDMWRLSLWAVLRYWAKIKVAEPSIRLFGQVGSDYTFALRERFNGGVLDPFWGRRCGFRVD